MMSDRNRYNQAQYNGYRASPAPRRPAEAQPRAYDPYAQSAPRSPYAQQRPVQPSAPQRVERPPQRRPASRVRTVDMVVLMMLFIGGPLCGLLGLFFRFMLWVFLGVEAAALAIMWGFRCFILRGRIVLSCVLLVLMTLALLAGINVGSGPEQFTTYGGNDPQQFAVKGTSTEPPWGAVSGVGLGGLTSMENATPAPLQQPQEASNMPGTNLSGTTVTDQQLHGTQPYDGTVYPTMSPTQSPMSTVLVAAEAVMKSYMQNWQQQNWENMVQYVTPTWRSAQTNAQLQLYWNHGIWLLDSWTMTAQNAEMNADSIIFSVLADLSKNTSTGERVTKRFDAIVLKVDETWYVDPDSMRTGIVVTETANAMGASNAAAAQQTAAEGGQPQVVSNSSDAQPSGTNPNLTLWYNSDGGSYYHLMQKCASIGSQYYEKMKAFTYSELENTAYKNLKPCLTCGAPARP